MLATCYCLQSARVSSACGGTRSYIKGIHIFLPCITTEVFALPSCIHIISFPNPLAVLRGVMCVFLMGSNSYGFFLTQIFPDVGNILLPWPVPCPLEKHYFSWLIWSPAVFFWSFKLKPPVSYLYVGSLSPVPRTWTALSETPVTASIYIILLSLDTHIVQDGVPDTL